MSTRRRTHRRHIITAVLAALVVPVVRAAAPAVPADMQYPRPVPKRAGPTPSDFTPPPRRSATRRPSSGRRSPGPQPRRHQGRLARRQPRPAVRRPPDDPGRAPERTIVRDTDEVLPITLSGAALLVALGLAGTALIRVRWLRLG